MCYIIREGLNERVSVSNINKSNENESPPQELLELFVEKTLINSSQSKDIWGVNDRAISHSVWAGFFLTLDYYIKKNTLDNVNIYFYTGGDEDVFSKVKKRVETWVGNFDQFMSGIHKKINCLRIFIDSEDGKERTIPFISDLISDSKSQDQPLYIETKEPKRSNMFFQPQKRENLSNFYHFLYIEGFLNKGKKVSFLRCEFNTDTHEALWAVNPKFISKDGKYGSFEDFFKNIEL